MPTHPPRPYDAAVAQNNQNIARGIYGDSAETFARVWVLVEDRTTGDTPTISFQLPLFANPNVLQRLTIPWDRDSVWAPLPSTLDSQATVDDIGPPPAKDSIGVLYVHRKHLEHKTLAATATPIYLADTPKFPRNLPDGPKFSEVEVFPLGVTITGIELANTQHSPGSVDVFDPRYGDPDQVIEIDRKSGAVTLALTDAGLARFGLSSPDALAAALGVLAATSTSPAPEIARALRVVARAFELGSASELEPIRSRLAALGQLGA